MRKRTLPLLAVGVAGALAAPAGAAAPPVKHAQVGDFFIKPGRLTVTRGTKVTWRWVGGFHNVTVTRGPVKFHSATKAGGTYSHLFLRRGTYVLVCTIHYGMRETVVVK
jgi:plastocyanin